MNYKFLNNKLSIVNCQLSILLVLDGCLHESHKQRMRVQYRTAVFRMELSADKPLQCRDLNDFHQIRFGVDTHAFHTGSFVLSLIVIVDVILFLLYHPELLNLHLTNCKIQTLFHPNSLNFSEIGRASCRERV